MKSQKTIPVVTCAMVQPFLAAVLNHGASAAALLADTGLSVEQVRAGSEVIPGQQWYDLAERAAGIVGDPYLGYRIGHEAAIETLPNLVVVDTELWSLGDVLQFLVADAARISSMATYLLSSDGKEASLVTERTFHPSSQPAQIDAYFAGFMVRFFEMFCAEKWGPDELTIRISRPSAIPEMLPRSSLRHGDRRGAWFTFPADWLLYRGSGKADRGTTHANAALQLFLPVLQRLLDLHLHRPSLTLDLFAGLTAQSPSRLKRLLAVHGTTFLHELDHRRATQAKALLTNSDLGLADIGKNVGFQDPTAFSRVFKRWTGQTPGSYRQAE